MLILQDGTAVNFLQDDAIKSTANIIQNGNLFDCTNSNARPEKMATK